MKKLQCAHPGHASRRGQPGWPEFLGTCSDDVPNDHGMMCELCAKLYYAALPPVGKSVDERLLALEAKATTTGGTK